MKKSSTALPDEELTRIKKLTVIAVVSDDELLDQLVLKGGNAIDLIYGLSERSSVDLDFSTASDIDQRAVLQKLERSLVSTFKDAGYVAFDIRMAQRPEKMPRQLAAFWGGYCLEFKLIQLDRATALHFEIEEMRRQAIIFGGGSRFTIDISRHEYVEHKREAAVEGYTVYVYSPEMIVCEKLRAICQQLPDYGSVIQRASVGGKSRARDFVDIDLLTRKYRIDLAAQSAHHMIREMFRIKKVPLSYLGRLAETKQLHAAEFDAVKASMRPNVRLEAFDYYFQRVLEQCRRLEPLWHE